jgi:AcrR family transcriptional regulator
VGRAALDFLGRRGAGELTMRSLATDLGVSPRALYNYVEDRRDLIAVAAEIFESGWQPPPLDSSPAKWRESLGLFCRDLRAHYRRHPGMTSLALSENITMARHPVMLRNVDALIGFFERVGLPLADAYLACGETLRMVVGFVEFQDGPHDRPPESVEPSDMARVPPPWLTPHERDAGVELPQLSRLAGLAPATPDALFDFALRTLTEGLAARITR